MPPPSEAPSMPTQVAAPTSVGVSFRAWSLRGDGEKDNTERELRTEFFASIV